jgi:cell division protein FtsB
MDDARPHYRCDDSHLLPAPAPAVILAAESLRSSRSEHVATANKGDERIPLFWRIFGGTLLSLAGLVGITVYQQFNNTLNELHAEMDRLSESRSDFLKKDEFTTRTTSIWNGVKEAQTAANAAAPLRERSAVLEQQMKAAEEERKEMAKEIQHLRERLAALEARQSNAQREQPLSKP